MSYVAKNHSVWKSLKHQSQKQISTDNISLNKLEKLLQVKCVSGSCSVWWRSHFKMKEKKKVIDERMHGCIILPGWNNLNFSWDQNLCALFSECCPDTRSWAMRLITREDVIPLLCSNWGCFTKWMGIKCIMWREANEGKSFWRFKEIFSRVFVLINWEFNVVTDHFLSYNSEASTRRRVLLSILDTSEVVPGIGWRDYL